MSSWKKNFFIISAIGILIGTASWAFYQIINLGIEDMLSYYGLNNQYLQSAIVIVVVVVLLALLGYKAKSIIAKIRG